VKILRLSSVFLCLLSLAIISCGMYPWTNRGNPVDTDKVVITKITAYGTQKDGISPLKGQVGAVTFPHKIHEEKAGLKCINCHHKHDNDARIKQCAKCHNGYAGYDRMHGLCVDCHISKGKGPQKCMECH